MDLCNFGFPVLWYYSICCIFSLKSHVLTKILFALIESKCSEEDCKLKQNVEKDLEAKMERKM